MNPINPVCRPATENEINYGEAKWCAKCTSECDSKGKDELVMCDYFKTNDNDPIVPGCPSLMPHALPGGFDSFAPAEEGTPMPEPCPFCGGETHINLGHLNDGVVHYWVDCISPECMYRSAHYTDKDTAIAAHNRVARAVRAAKESEAGK